MAKEFRISASVHRKLQEKHSVTRDEILQCFMNRDGPLFEDSRHDHRTEPPTYWFVAQTDHGRTLKVVYVEHAGFFAIKTAFEPRDGSDQLYRRLSAGTP